MESDLRQEVRAFLRDEPFTPAVDNWLSGFDPAFSRRVGARGWIGMTWPAEYGGGGRTARERFVVLEELVAAGAPVAYHWIADRQIGPALLAYGTEKQRRAMLPAIARGEMCVAVGLSEPGSGSDLASVTTRATPDGDGWRITGAKTWTSGAHVSAYIVVLTRTGDALTQFLVPTDAPGVTVRPVRWMDGEHDVNDVFLDDVAVGPDDVLGAVGQGWQQVMSELAYERSGPERFLSTVPLLDAYARPGRAPASSVGALAAQLWSVRQLSLEVAAALDRGGAPNVEAALVKDLGTRFEQSTVDEVRRHDRDGALRPLLDRAVLRAPVFTLRGGTNEILRGIIAGGLGL